MPTVRGAQQPARAGARRDPHGRFVSCTRQARPRGDHACRRQVRSRSRAGPPPAWGPGDGRLVPCGPEQQARRGSHRAEAKQPSVSASRTARGGITLSHQPSGVPFSASRPAHSGDPRTRTAAAPCAPSSPPAQGPGGTHTAGSCRAPGRPARAGPTSHVSRAACPPAPADPRARPHRRGSARPTAHRHTRPGESPLRPRGRARCTAPDHTPSRPPARGGRPPAAAWPAHPPPGPMSASRSSRTPARARVSGRLGRVLRFGTASWRRGSRATSTVRPVTAPTGARLG